MSKEEQSPEAPSSGQDPEPVSELSAQPSLSQLCGTLVCHSKWVCLSPPPF